MSSGGDAAFMAQALELAARGRGGVSPNPMVGALIVKDGAVVGAGWHHRAGAPHAEIEALASLRSAGDARGASMYVTLEPCCHWGRTGPCTQAIIKAGIARVVVAAGDPNPLVAGKGLAELAAAGIAVEAGILRAEAEALNRVFAKWITTRRPYVTLKLALTLDGRIAARPGETSAVTGQAARRRVHAMRADADAVMIGSATALTDAPQLTVREAVPNAEFTPPWRVVLDSTLRTPLDAPLFLPEPPGAIAATALAPGDPRARALSERGVRVLSLAKDGRIDLEALMLALGSLEPKPVTSVLCEGGGVLAAALLSAELVDELVLFFAPKLFGHGGVPAFASLSELSGFALASLEALGDDAVLTYRRA